MSEDFSPQAAARRQGYRRNFEPRPMWIMGGDFCFARKRKGVVMYLRRDGWRRCCGPRGIFTWDEVKMMHRAFLTQRRGR
jgi:hypothetical protein